jgi:hypothetical protein
MMKNNYNEDFYANLRGLDVWKRLSKYGVRWSINLIDRYQNKIDWKCFSENNNVHWTTSLLEKHQDKLDWKALSSGSCSGLFSTLNLKRFSSKWDWSELSSNSSVDWNMEKVEEFKGLIDWDKFITCGCNPDLLTLKFYMKYKEYFPKFPCKTSSCGTPNKLGT